MELKTNFIVSIVLFWFMKSSFKFNKTLSINIVFLEIVTLIYFQLKLKI